MFSNTDYKSLLSAGVEPGMIALVESAFAAIFEASAPALKNKLIPFPYDEVAGWLNIDVDDCVIDGKLNTNMLVRKLNEDSRFRKVDSKVNHIVSLALDYAGVAYKDDSGVTRFVYPALEKTGEFKNVVENIKTVLKKRLLSSSAGMEYEQFINKVDSILDDHAAKYLANTIIDNISSASLKRVQPNIEEQYVEHWQFRDMPGKWAAVEEKFNIQVTNEDGTTWGKRKLTDADEDLELDPGEPDTATTENIYLVVCDYESSENRIVGYPCKLQMEVDGDSRSLVGIMSVYDKYGERYQDNSIGYSSSWLSSGISAINAVIHDIVNYIVSGRVNQIKFSEDSLDHISSSTLTRNMSIDDIVRIVRCKNLNAEDLWEEFRKSGVEHRVDLLRFLVECYDTGLADADDFAEWAEHMDDDKDNQGWYASALDPELASMAAKYHLLSLGDSKGDLRSNSVIGHEFRYNPEDIIKAVTGKDVSINVATDSDVERYDNSYDDMPVKELAVFARPAVQKKLYERIGFPRLLYRLEYATKYFGYIPLSDEVVDMALTETTGFFGENATELTKYYDRIVDDEVDISGEFHTTSRKCERLFAEIRRNLTPDVQDAVIDYQDDSMIAYRMLRRIARRVPGFEMNSRAGENSLDTSNHSTGTITPKTLVKIMRQMKDNGCSTREMLHSFLTVCLDPNILSVVNSNNPVGKRIRGIFEWFAQEDKLDVIRYSLLDDYLNGENEGIPEYLSAYVIPSWSAVALTDDDVVQGPRTKNAYSNAIRTYMWAYEFDESIAIKAFIDRKCGVFKCTSQRLVDVPTTDGKKGGKRMVQRDETMAALELAIALASNVRGTSPIPKSAIAMISSCIAGKGLFYAMHDSEYHNNTDDIAALFALDKLYRTAGPSGDNAPEVISMEEIRTMMGRDPGFMLSIVGSMDQELAKEVCDNCFTVDIVRSMSASTEGLELLLRLAERGNVDNAKWRTFAEAFATGNENNIKNLLKTLPEDDAKTFMEKLKPYMGSNSSTGGNGYAAVSGSEISAQLGTRVSFGMANGLRWMKGYLNIGNPGSHSEDGQVGLYTREQAAQFDNSDGWHLPTLNDIIHLGDNPETISEEALGFTPTGMAEPDGTLITGSEDFCFAWCMGPDGPVGYSVDTNNVIDTDDGNIQPEFLLAIKLVR